ncbi:MAG: hypothetical protein O9330_14940 [Beijerinckiaceae bacterium]|nr:hypothetical protein [Beijerinckiaceae bacterium]
MNGFLQHERADMDPSLDRHLVVNQRGVYVRGFPAFAVLSAASKLGHPETYEERHAASQGFLRCFIAPATGFSDTSLSIGAEAGPRLGAQSGPLCLIAHDQPVGAGRGCADGLIGLGLV